MENFINAFTKYSIVALKKGYTLPGYLNPCCYGMDMERRPARRRFLMSEMLINNIGMAIGIIVISILMLVVIII